VRSNCERKFNHRISFFAILLKESAKKKNPQYQGEAIYAVCLCCEVFHLEAGANEIAPRIDGILMGKFEQNSDDDEDAMETDAKMERNEKRLKLQKRVADSYGHWLLTFEYAHGSFTEGLNLLCSVLDNSSCFWQIKMALVDALKYALERWKVVETIDGTRLFRVLSFVVRESSQRSLAEHGVVDIICLVNLMAAGRIRLTVEEAEISALQKNEVCMASTTLMDLLKNHWNNGDGRDEKMT